MRKYLKSHKLILLLLNRNKTTNEPQVSYIHIFNHYFTSWEAYFILFETGSRYVGQASLKLSYPPASTYLKACLSQLITLIFLKHTNYNLCFCDLHQNKANKHCCSTHKTWQACSECSFMKQKHIQRSKLWDTRKCKKNAVRD